MDRKTLKRRIFTKFDDMKEAFIEQFISVLDICLTIDIWSCNRRSFLGVTAHWIVVSGGKVERRSAALACRRFRGNF